MKTNIGISSFCKCLCLFFLLVITKTAYSRSGNEICDSNLTPIQGELGYRQRGNRCEGFYRAQVASISAISVIGFIKGSLHFDLSEDEVIEVSVPALPIDLHIRAVGIPFKTYYRMDSRIAPGEKLIWPVKDVIYPAKLSAKTINVFGWIEQENEIVYVPVSAKAKIDSAIYNEEEINLYLRASLNMQKVLWRFYEVIDGVPSQLSPWKQDTESFYRFGEPIRITLPSSSTGEIYVEVAGVEEGRTHWISKRVRVIVY